MVCSVVPSAFTILDKSVAFDFKAFHCRTPNHSRPTYEVVNEYIIEIKGAHSRIRRSNRGYAHALTGSLDLRINVR